MPKLEMLHSFLLTQVRDCETQLETQPHLSTAGVGCLRAASGKGLSKTPMLLVGPTGPLQVTYLRSHFIERIPNI